MTIKETFTLRIGRWLELEHVPGDALPRYRNALAPSAVLPWEWRHEAGLCHAVPGVRNHHKRRALTTPWRTYPAIPNDRSHLPERG